MSCLGAHGIWSSGFEHPNVRSCISCHLIKEAFALIAEDCGSSVCNPSDNYCIWAIQFQWWKQSSESVTSSNHNESCQTFLGFRLRCQKLPASNDDSDGWKDQRSYSYVKSTTLQYSGRCHSFLVVIHQGWISIVECLQNTNLPRLVTRNEQRDQLERLYLLWFGLPSWNAKLAMPMNHSRRFPYHWMGLRTGMCAKGSCRHQCSYLQVCEAANPLATVATVVAHSVASLRQVLQGGNRSSGWFSSDISAWR